MRSNPAVMHRGRPAIAIDGVLASVEWQRGPAVQHNR